jgi:hypothetical protein
MDVTLTGVFDSRRIQGFHATYAASFAKITSMVVGQAHDIKAGAYEILNIRNRSPESVANFWILACFYGTAAIKKCSLQIPKRYICVSQMRLDTFH